MFQKGAYIIYGNTGVCRVEDVGVPENFSAADPARTYYTLKPVYDVGNIYTPVDTSVYMRAIISEAEATALVATVPDLVVDAFDTRNMKLLSDHYLEMIASHDCARLLQLIKTVGTKARHAAAQGKRPGQTDQRFLKRAEELLYGELALALSMPIEQVPDYMNEQLFPV